MLARENDRLKSHLVKSVLQCKWRNDWLIFRGIFGNSTLLHDQYFGLAGNGNSIKAYKDSSFLLHVAARGELKLRNVTGLKHILKRNSVKASNK